MTNINTITTSNSITNKNSPVVINEENFNDVKNSLGTLHGTLCILEGILSPAFNQISDLNALFNKSISFNLDGFSDVARHLIGKIITCSMQLENHVYNASKMSAALLETIRDLNYEINKTKGKRII